MSIHKDNRSNTWYVKRHNETKRGFKYKRDAIEYEANLIAKPNSNTIRFIPFADEFLKFKKTDVQYTTYLKYKECINIVMKPLFPNIPIDEITFQHCDEFKEKLSRLDYSTSYKNKLITQMKGMFNFGVRRKYISDNPARLLKSFRKTTAEIEKKRSTDNNVWTYEEFSKFIECVEDEKYKALYITLFTTGCRLGEALALTWTDLSDSKLSITKSHTKQTEKGSYEIKIPKSNCSIRKISLNPSLNAYLLDYKEQCKRNNRLFEESDFIFGGKKPLARTTIETIKNKAIEKSGVKKIRIHDFRHSHATILINNGMNIVAVSKRLGHSDVSMTLKIYTHLLEKSDEEIMDFLEKSSHNSSQLSGPKK